jgi:hypothetical protein
MAAHSKDSEFARINLSQCVDHLALVLARVRAQEPFLCEHRDPYFNQMAKPTATTKPATAQNTLRDHLASELVI